MWFRTTIVHRPGGAHRGRRAGDVAAPRHRHAHGSCRGSAAHPPDPEMEAVLAAALACTDADDFRRRLREAATPAQ